ncbi:MAG: chemotaxis protein CheA [Ketobacteraceae bacterium]|nr:chemotaxis protein CheA [Ketobacteraceae bacterium]
MLNEEQWQQLLEDYIEEAQELIQRSESALAALKKDPASSESINELFRAVHTIKGNSGMLSLDHIVGFTHVFEDLLMQLRDGLVIPDADIVDLFFKCIDFVADLISAVADGSGETELSDHGQTLLAKLESHSAKQDNNTSEDAVATALCRESHWHLGVRFSKDLFRCGFDPLSLIRYLNKICLIEAVELVRSRLPSDPEAFDPESCYLAMHVTFTGDVEQSDILEVFEFLDDLATLYIHPPGSEFQDFQAMVAELDDADEEIAGILHGLKLISEEELSILSQDEKPDTVSPASQLSDTEAVPEQQPAGNAVVPDPVTTAPLKEQTATAKKRSENSFLRVPAKKMDELINQVGELVIAVAGSRIMANQRKDLDMIESIEGLHNQIELIREAALQMRMVEINETFNRFHRVVRETAGALGKEIHLEIKGGDTELDKSLVDKIHDPLVHLVRNAIDHGIESVAERKQAGKSETGHLLLNAYHDSGMIVLEVSDDGGGIDADKIREKAIEKELIRAEDELSRSELLSLIFHAGFSTAKEVSDLSGRGVGLDSVRRDIDALRGSIEIDSTPGEGTRFSIKLPLTLAIIDGFLVSVNDQSFVVPVEWVTECIETPSDSATSGQGNYMDLRGKPMAYVSLREVMGLDGGASDRESMIVISYGGESLGLTVDELHGEIQTVIKPLGPIFEQLEPISGGTILGSGAVALIVDVPGVFSRIKSLTQWAKSA